MKLRTLAPVLAVAVLAAGPAAASPPVVAHDKDAKPVTPGFAPLGTTFDCAGRDTLLPFPGWSLTVVDSTTDAASVLPGYACRNWAEAGPEHVYRLELDQELEFSATLSDLAVDLDLFLLDGCDTDACLGYGNTEIAAILPPGIYWLVVDTFGSGSPPGGAYTLTLGARWPGVPTAACDLAAPVAAACAELDTLAGDLEGATDLLRVYDCGTAALLRGGEDWYALAAPSLRMVELAATPLDETLDLALALFSGCGQDAVCLAFADEALAGGVETLAWPQAAATADTVWLAVDCYRAPDAGAGGYELTTDCGTVDAEPAPFGGVKALFR